MNSVVWRIVVFYLGSIFVVVALVPWDSTRITQSPYTAVLQQLRIPGAATAMNLVVLTAVLSCLNSGLYTASRMLFVLAGRREAPMTLITVNSRGVPVWAILASAFFGGRAGFCQVASGQIYATFVEPALFPAGCEPVSIVVYTGKWTSISPHLFPSLEPLAPFSLPFPFGSPR